VILRELSLVLFHWWNANESDPHAEFARHMRCTAEDVSQARLYEKRKARVESCYKPRNYTKAAFALWRCRTLVAGGVKCPIEAAFYQVPDDRWPHMDGDEENKISNARQRRWSKALIERVLIRERLWDMAVQ